MAEVAKENVLQLVARLSELQLLEVCDSEDLKLTKTKKDRKSALKNLLILYISSEDVEDATDDGLALFEKLSTQMRELLNEDEEEVKRLQQEQEMKARLMAQQEEEMKARLMAQQEQEMKEQLMAMEMESKLKALKTTIDEFEAGGTGDLSGGGKVDSVLARLAESKSSDVSFESIIDRIVTERLKSGVLNMSADSGSGGGQFNSLTGDSGSDGAIRNATSEGIPTVTTTTTTELHKLKLREFKIANGNVGVEGSLDYSDLIMQMKEGLAGGYSQKEVMSGVRRATKPGSELRKYLVRNSSMSYEDFKQTLREFYNVRESQSIMDEMREMVQGENQDLLKYVMSMCALRDEVFEVSAAEDCPPGEALVKKRFVNSLLSGLRKPTVRLEMQAVLKLELSDPKLFNEVNQIDKRVKENEKKVGNEVQAAEVKAVEVGKKRAQRQEDAWRDETAAKLESLTTQVSKLEAMISKVAGVNASSKSSDGSLDEKMASLLAQVQHLTAQMQEYQSGGTTNGSNNNSAGSSGKFRFKNKCDDCEREKKFCRHCRKCKKEGHKEANCPEN